jgi:hypothetical protein
VPVSADPNGQVLVHHHAVINVHAFHARLEELKRVCDRLAQFKTLLLAT